MYNTYLVYRISIASVIYILRRINIYVPVFHAHAWTNRHKHTTPTEVLQQQRAKIEIYYKWKT